MSLWARTSGPTHDITFSQAYHARPNSIAQDIFQSNPGVSKPAIQLQTTSMYVIIVNFLHNMAAQQEVHVAGLFQGNVISL